MIKINRVINGVYFDVQFKDRVNFIKGASGTGKTFLFNVMSLHCVNSRIPYAFIDYRFLATGDEGLIFLHCVDKKVIILDNADLYLTPALFDKIRSLDAIIILSKKSTFGLNMNDAHLYSVSYIGSSLTTRRLC